MSVNEESLTNACHIKLRVFCNIQWNSFDFSSLPFRLSCFLSIKLSTKFRFVNKMIAKIYCLWSARNKMYSMRSFLFLIFAQSLYQHISAIFNRLKSIGHAHTDKLLVCNFSEQSVQRECMGFASQPAQFSNKNRLK